LSQIRVRIFKVRVRDGVPNLVARHATSTDSLERVDCKLLW